MDRNHSASRGFKVKQLAFIGVLSVTVAFLTGCQTSIPSTAQLVGTWTNRVDSSTVVLHRNGDCQVSGIATASLVPGADRSATLSGRCTWHLGDFLGAKRASDGNPMLSIRMSATDLAVDGFVVEVGGSDEIYWLVGDPDDQNRYEFQKK